MKVEVRGDVNRIYDRYQLENALREREQREKRLKAQVDLLDTDNYREYCARRAAEPLLMVEPDIPLDEMSFSDFKLARAHKEHTLEQPHLEPGEMSFRDYKLHREQQRRRRR